MNFSPAGRLANLNPSIIREMTRLAYEHGAINLSQGFPEFSPPREVITAVTEAIASRQNQYSITWGIPALREALAEVYQRWYGLTFDPYSDITVTCGVTEAIIATLFSLLDKGDKVIVLEPAHENYRPGIAWAGGEGIWVPLRAPEFALNEDDLRSAFAQNPKAIILNSPHNPTGRVFSRAELQLVADLCQQYDVIAITDEIYEHILYDGREHIPLATLPGMFERTITTSGLSKAYSATGWRIGWVVAPPHLSNGVRMVHDYLTICAPTPLQVGAVAALNLPDSYYEKLRTRYHGCRARMMEVLQSAGFTAQAPEGSYYVMADFSGIRPGDTATEFAHWLTREKKVAVVPGHSFYRAPNLGQNLVRFAYPKHPATFDEVIRRLG